MRRPLQSLTLNREHQLDPAEEVAFHPVGAGAVDFFVAAVVEVVAPAVLEKPSDDANARECSREIPGTPGRRQQMPRTMRSINTPALEASVQRRMISGSTRALSFAMMWPVSADAR